MEYNVILDRKMELESRLQEINDELVELGDEKDTVHYNIVQYEALLESEANKLDKFTGDDFVDDFIRASLFCDRLNKGTFLQLVSVTKNFLVALDGYMLIKIYNNHIPKNLYNKYITWYTRKDFDKGISNLKIENFINYDEMIPEDEFKYVIENATTRTFKKLLKIEKIKTNPIMRRVIYKDCLIYMQQKHLDAIFKALGGETFTVKFTNFSSPIIFQNNHMSIMITSTKIAQCYKTIH